MADVDELAAYFPGVDVDYLERVAGELENPIPEHVADVLDAAAAMDLVPPGDYRGQLRAQVQADLVAVACDECGKAFLGASEEEATRKVNGHRGSHSSGSDSGTVTVE